MGVGNHLSERVALAGLVQGIASEISEKFNHGAEIGRMDPVFGFFHADDPVSVGILGEDRECEESEGSFRQRPGRQLDLIRFLEFQSDQFPRVVSVDEHAAHANAGDRTQPRGDARIRSGRVRFPPDSGRRVATR